MVHDLLTNLFGWCCFLSKGFAQFGGLVSCWKGGKCDRLFFFSFVFLIFLPLFSGPSRSVFFRVSAVCIIASSLPELLFPPLGWVPLAECVGFVFFNICFRNQRCCDPVTCLNPRNQKSPLGTFLNAHQLCSPLKQISLPIFCSTILFLVRTFPWQLNPLS